MKKTFKEFLLKESITVDAMVQVSGLIGSIISQGIIMVAQSHLVHWKVDMYGNHVVLGEFYEELQEGVDSLAEKSIGIGFDVTTQQDFSAQFTFNMDLDDFVEDLTQYRNIVSQGLGSTKDPSISSINDQLIKIQNLIDETLFKLNLV